LNEVTEPFLDDGSRARGTESPEWGTGFVPVSC